MPSIILPGPPANAAAPRAAARNLSMIPAARQRIPKAYTASELEWWFIVREASRLDR